MRSLIFTVLLFHISDELSQIFTLLFPFEIGRLEVESFFFQFQIVFIAIQAKLLIVDSLQNRTAMLINMLAVSVFAILCQLSDFTKGQFQAGMGIAHANFSHSRIINKNSVFQNNQLAMASDVFTPI